MKKLVVFVLLMSSINIFSQETFPLNIEKESQVDNVYEKVDKQPEYPGGINAFRNNFARTFDSSKINGKGIIKSELGFVIDKDGMITEIVALGDNKSMNKEMERSIKAMSKTKWMPAELEEKPVKFRFKLPITMSFE